MFCSLEIRSVLAAQMAQHLDRVAALADSVAEVRAAASMAEAQGKRGLEEVSRLREQKVPSHYRTALWGRQRQSPTGLSEGRRVRQLMGVQRSVSGI